MTKPQRFASSLRLSRLCRWLLTAAAIKVALLVAFALEQPWPFATGGEPAVVATAVAPAPGARAAAQPGSGLDLPLTADIASATGVPATLAAASPDSAVAPAVTAARGRMHRDGTAWAAEAQPAPSPATSPAASAASTAPPTGGVAGAAAGGQNGLLNRDDLNRRQEDLNRREQELKSLEQQIDAKLAQMQDLEARIKIMLKDAQGMKDEKLRHLVDVYTNMKAKQAAAVLETLDEKIAVRILAGMRGRQAGEILTFVQAEKAAKLSEALTRMQLPLE
jgi:flagellar motility protein MotE (MotC chaperone)